MTRANQTLPRTGPAREALREKGQFWTPDWVADAMVAYVRTSGAACIFDPAVGSGAFFHAAKRAAKVHGQIELLGTEIDPRVLEEAVATGLTRQEMARVQSRDFVLDPPSEKFPAIVANPPYIRHHRLDMKTKAYLRALGQKIIGAPLDGRAGLHVYFLMQALERLAPHGRLAFIMPADTVEGVFALPLWSWITGKFRLEAVITFEADATPFPGVDTNAIIFMVRNAQPEAKFAWARCDLSGQANLAEWVASRFTRRFSGLKARLRSVDEALETGLSRPPGSPRNPRYVLGDFANVLRGIATGANEFFFLTADKAVNLRIPSEFLAPAIGRTRDVEGDEITAELIRKLEKAGKPTLLFSPDGREVDSFPSSVKHYIKRGEEMGITARPLVGSRRPWYKMERRKVPPFLFAYLGRRNARFIRNTAAVKPLTGFLCVYPHREDREFLDSLWNILRHPETVANLRLVGKSYGGGAIKVEPRALERLPLPKDLAQELEELSARPKQLQLGLSSIGGIRTKRTRSQIPSSVQ